MSGMFIKDQITVAIQRNTLEKIQKRKKKALLLYLPNINNKVFCFLPVPLFIDSDAVFKKLNPGNIKNTHTQKK